MSDMIKEAMTQAHQQMQPWWDATNWPSGQPTADYTARLEAVRLSLKHVEHSMEVLEFPQVMRHAHSIYRFLTGQSCPACGPDKVES